MGAIGIRDAGEAVKHFVPSRIFAKAKDRTQIARAATGRDAVEAAIAGFYQRR